MKQIQYGGRDKTCVSTLIVIIVIIAATTTTIIKGYLAVLVIPPPLLSFHVPRGKTLLVVRASISQRYSTTTLTLGFPIGRLARSRRQKGGLNRQHSECSEGDIARERRVNG